MCEAGKEKKNNGGDGALQRGGADTCQHGKPAWAPSRASDVTECTAGRTHSGPCTLQDRAEERGLFLFFFLKISMLVVENFKHCGKIFTSLSLTNSFFEFCSALSIKDDMSVFVMTWC